VAATESVPTRDTERRKMNIKPRTTASLAFALIPLGFLIGFALYAHNRWHVPWLLLAAGAVAAAAVPFTVTLFASGNSKPMAPDRNGPA
jgi:hypothetical protein